MKLQAKKRSHVALNSGEEVKFDISPEFVTHAIGMLVKQYSNPEMAFIRETCSNAYDAHTAAGTEDTPFDIHLPSNFSPYIEIRDYGTGISEEFMLNRYVSVGDSTKRKSNTEIGGFGIGRLSFLIVTQQAAITSYYNGVKYGYTCRYNENQVLVISQTDKRPTTEPNGLRLKFPVQLNRIQSFRRAAQDYFKRVTSTLPNFKGSEPLIITPTKYTHKGENWGLREPDGSNNIYAIMGNIAYPVRPEVLENDTRFADVTDILRTRADLFFEIGEVTPLPTRENLEMNDETVNALLTRLTQLKADILTKVETEVARSKNMYQAFKNYHQLVSATSYEMTRLIHSLNVSYKGKPVRAFPWRFESPKTEYVKKIPQADGSVKELRAEVTELDFFQRASIGYGSTRRFSWGKGINVIDTNYNCYLQHCFVFNDTSKGCRPLIDYNYPNPCKIVLVQGSKEGWEKFKAFHIAQGFNPRGFNLVSQLLPKPKRVKSLAATATVSVLQLPTFSFYNPMKGNCRTAQYKEVTDQKCYYVLASNYKVSKEDFDKLKLMQSFVNTGLLEHKNIVLLNKNRQHLLGEEEEWEHFSNYVKVDEKLRADKRKQTYRVCYYAAKLAGLQKTYHSYLRDDVLDSAQSRYFGGKRVYCKIRNWEGKLIDNTPRYKEARKTFEFLITRYRSYLETLKDTPPYRGLLAQVLHPNGGFDMSKARDLCKAFDINETNLMNEANKLHDCELTIDEMINSQVYFLQTHMRYKNGFDFEKLKKELKL